MKIMVLQGQLSWLSVVAKRTRKRRGVSDCAMSTLVSGREKQRKHGDPRTTKRKTDDPWPSYIFWTSRGSEILVYETSGARRKSRYFTFLFETRQGGVTINTSREVNKARRPHTYSRPYAFEEKQHTKSRAFFDSGAYTKNKIRKETIQHIFLAFSTPMAVSYQFFHVFPGEVPSAMPQPRAL